MVVEALKKEFKNCIITQNKHIVDYINSQIDTENAVYLTHSYFVDFVIEKRYSGESFVEGETLSTSKISIIDIITSEEFIKLVIENAKRLMREGIETFTAVVNAIFYSLKDIHANVEAVKAGKSRNAKAHILLAISQFDEVKDKKLTKKTFDYISEKAVKVAVKNRMRIRNLNDLIKLKEFCQLENVEFYNSSPPAHQQKVNQNQQLALF